MKNLLIIILLSQFIFADKFKNYVYEPIQPTGNEIEINIDNGVDLSKTTSQKKELLQDSPIIETYMTDEDLGPRKQVIVELNNSFELQNSKKIDDKKYKDLQIKDTEFEEIIMINAEDQFKKEMGIIK